MIIILTAKGEDESSKIDHRFGRCEYFIVHDTEEISFKAIENSAKNSSHGAGVQAAQIIADLKPDVVITGNVGPKAFEGLKTAGITVYLSEDSTVSAAIDEYGKGNLIEIEEPTSERHSNL